MLATIDWTAAQPTLKHLPIGLFGASTGAAAARDDGSHEVGALHGCDQRGGRPDLAGDALKQVKAPTMLIVGGYDDAVLVLNEQAKKKMTCEVSLKVVPRATHLFEEPGALSQAADFASSWFWGTLKTENAKAEQ